MSRRGFLFLAAALVAGGARAQTYTVDSLTTWSIGTVAAAATGTTVFLNSSGSISVVSGSGSVMGGSPAGETVSIRCVDQGGNLCSNSNNKARIRIGRTGVNTGRAQTITALGAYSGTGTIGAGTNETNATVDVPMSGWTASNQVRTFILNCFLPIGGDDGAGSTGAASSQYYVYVAKDPTTPTTGLTGTVTATVRRALTLTKVSDLRFGTFIAPTTGTDYVAVDASGNRVKGGSDGFSAGTIVLVPSSYGPAEFTAAGEPGTTFSLTVPSTMTMSGPGASISVNLVPSPGSGTQTLPAGGTLSLKSGGAFNVSAGQASGNYSGSFTVTIAYN